MNGWRVFSTALSRSERRIYLAVVLYFLAVAAASVWPIYPWFARARPIVAGLPLSLFYLAVLLLVSFAVLFALYRWEVKRGTVEGVDSGARTDGREGGEA